MKTLILCFYLVILGITTISYGQQLTPPIQNYTPSQYAAASQNWNLAIDSLGIVYAANNEGLLIFDGQQWELNSLSSGSIIRSVISYEGRIFTGSYKEFGYWEREDTGEMTYTSLVTLMEGYQMQNEEIWEIIPFNNSLYFRSFGAIYKYDGKKIIQLQDVLTNSMVAFEDQLFVSAGPRGIFRLEEDGNIIKLQGQEILNGQIVIDFEVDGDQLLLGTLKGLYVYKNGKFQVFGDNKLNAQLENYELNHLKKISENEFVFATVKNGVIYYNKRTGDAKIYNRSSGLQNNTILSLALHKGKLWLGLDNGIDVIDLDSPVKFYTDDSGELGAVYDLIFHNSEMYLASNTGVYQLRENGLFLLNGAEGHTWNLEEINGVLYANHNRGTYKIEGKSLIPIESRTGSFAILQPPGREPELLIGNYTGISIYKPESEKVSVLRDVNFPIKKMVFENPEVIWAAHPYEGLYRIGLSNNTLQTSFIEKVHNAKGRKNLKADVFKINNQIAVLQDNIWYKYNSLVDSLFVFEDLKDYKNHRLLYEDRTGYWFTNTISNSIVFTNFKEKKLNLAFKELNERLVKGNENLIRFNDSIYYITLNDGFGKINLRELLRNKEREELNRPIILNIKDTQGNYSLSHLPSIPYRQAREVKIRVALPDSEAMELRYEMEGENGISGIISNGNLVFQNLSYGDYNLNLYALSAQGKTSEVTTLNFEILPPWYLSSLMKMFYILMLLGVIALMYWYNRRKLKKHQQKLEQKFKEEHEEQLRKIEKERLVHEINSKRKELANTTMIGAKKNEVLMEIQGELNRDKDKFSNQFRLKHIMNKINRAIKSKDEWKLFETNFNELHEDFSKELLSAFPHLSNKDLKLCSYLKMNLSSKEIAPLMGISVRGVEVHRYRLRKKMNLDSKENLTNFLIRNF